MSKKYIKQIDNDNFLYPNNYLAEYDDTIIHDLKENSVYGIVTGFTTSLSVDKKSLTISYDYEWIRNGAEPYIMSDGSTALTSFHLMYQDSYFKPTQMTFYTNVSGATPDTYFESVSVVESYDNGTDYIWVEGDYFYEIRFIGHRAIYPIQGKFTITYPPPTPTPTPTPSATPPAPLLKYVVQLCGSGTQYVVQGTTNPSVGGSYRIYAPTCLGSMDGNNCWQIISTTGITEDCTGVIFGSNLGSCSDCASVTPTPTPTASPAPPTGIDTQLGLTIDICGVVPITCYTITGDIRPGVTLYYNSNLTGVVTGYNFVADYLYGTIYNINSTNGIIGTHTLYNC